MKNVVRISSVVLSLAFAGAAFAQATPATPAKPAAPGKSAHMEFNAVDQNKDGKISQSEALTHGELTAKFAALDADSDTYLTNSEFAKWNQMGKSGETHAPKSEAAPK